MTKFNNKQEPNKCNQSAFRVDALVRLRDDEDTIESYFLRNSLSVYIALIINEIKDFLTISSHLHVFRNIRKLPKIPGIYFVLNNDKELLYIGTTCNLKRRWKSHHLKKDLIDNKWYLVIKFYITKPFDTFEQEESFLIALLRPPLNKGINFIPYSHDDM